MARAGALEAKKKELVDELEGIRAETLTAAGRPVSMRAISLEVCDNPSYYTHLIKHPTSFPSSDRLKEIRKAFARFQKVYEIGLKLAKEDSVGHTSEAKS